MRSTLILTFSLLALIVSPVWANDPLTSVTVERVKAGSYKNPKFKAWPDAGVSNRGQKNTYIAIVNQPARDKVKRVVFISSGQQSDDVFNSDNGWGTGNYSQGYRNVLTGQPNNFKKNCEGNVKNCIRSIDPNSLAARTWASGQFEAEDTLFILALDMRFGYFRPTAEKQKRENAYWNFLTSKFDPENIEIMVLAGQSRGGCMMFRLGSRMRKLAAYQDIPLIVQGYDPVCVGPRKPTYAEAMKKVKINAGALFLMNAARRAAQEFPTGRVEVSPGNYLGPGFKSINNPVDNSKHSYVFDLDQIFPPANRKNLKVLDIHGGGEVGFDFVRSFTWKSKDVDLGWWQQKWVNVEHEEMGGNYGHAFQIGDIGYGHIYNYIEYELKLEEPKNFQAKQRFPVDVNGDKKSDIVLAYQDATKGLTLHTKLSNGDGTFSHVKSILGDGISLRPDVPLMSGFFNDDGNTDILYLFQHPTKGLELRTKISNGDGTYTNKRHISGDGPNILDMPAFVGDVNGDGLSDVILRYQHRSEGLHIRTKFSQGNGSFIAHDFKAGDGTMGDELRAHVGDVNGDRKTDLIYMYKRSDGNMEIRTRISNGNGTFGYKKSQPIKLINWGNLQTFVADVNRDKRTDIVILNRDKDGRLSVRTYISKGDGTYNFTSDQFPDGDEVDGVEAVIADVNGDRRSDIVMRVRDKTRGLIIRVKLSNGNGKYTSKEYVSGDGGQVDILRALTGNFDGGLRTDLALRFRIGQQGLKIRTKLGTQAGSFTAQQFNSGDGSAVDKMDALSGPIYWDGGGTFTTRSLNSGSAAVVGEVKKVEGLPNFKKGITPTRPKPKSKKIFQKPIIQMKKNKKREELPKK